MNISVFVLMVCLIGVHADVQPQRDFNLQRFAGRWYRVGLAYDSPSFLPHKEKLRVTAGVIAPQPNGSVNLTMWAMRPSGCVSALYQYERTNTPGHYNYFSTRHNRTKDITVVETNYTEYALVLKNKRFDREYTQVALYGRTQKLRHEIIQKFRTFSTARGFPRDSIITPHVSENCPPSAPGNGHGRQVTARGSPEDTLSGRNQRHVKTPLYGLHRKATKHSFVH
ncbi:neutrophil gelatinase-associated lipocalin isoform X1 [Gadus morhua]|uniref:neutrophil gelatinase-associated lipocalin isoform X1 n=1 Tax=Gadus morhua TaxID=8049 RepID=UPI0011B790E8|nr:neutrophil gelatinase-associated lipocalin isoform X1 [Gadus morhua]